MHPGSLFLALAALTPIAPCEEKVKLRFGHFPNVTHAQGVIAHGLSRAGKGWFEERLGEGVEIEWYVYNAGPSAMEAMLAGSLDVTYVGPNPALNAYIKSEGEEVRIVAGACSGGAALVIQADGRIQTDADFKGKRIATPQLGNTQDVAARAWLKGLGLKITQTGGDAIVLPTANADQLALFQKGEIDAAWTVEPWVSRLVKEANGKVYFDEKTLWPQTGGRYVTTHLVSSVAFTKEHAGLLKRIVAAHVELTDWINANPAEAKRLLNAEIAIEATKAIPAEILDSAWQRLEITHDPVRASLIQSAEDAYTAGFLKEQPDLSKIYDLGILNGILVESDRPEVP